VEVPSGGAVMNVDFSADKLTADLGETITFTDLTDNSPTHWSWRFGSEGQSIVQNPTFSFLTTGFKDITLLAGKCSSSV
jgi:PKD repeat protein